VFADETDGDESVLIQIEMVEALDGLAGADAAGTAVGPEAAFYCQKSIAEC
jgi:hypothetical protein